MKAQIEQLIDRLADKTLSFGCFVKDAKTGKMCRIAPEIVDVHIDEAGVKTLDVGGDPCCCGNIYRDSNDRFKILGHPILIGDVLDLASNPYAEELWEDEVLTHEKLLCQSQWGTIVKFWFRCGIKSSLQSIFDRAEWASAGNTGYTQPKQPEIRALFEFLLTLKI